MFLRPWSYDSRLVHIGPYLGVGNNGWFTRSPCLRMNPCSRLGHCSWDLPRLAVFTGHVRGRQQKRRRTWGYTHCGSYSPRMCSTRLQFEPLHPTWRHVIIIMYCPFVPLSQGLRFENVLGGSLSDDSGRRGLLNWHPRHFQCISLRALTLPPNPG